MITSILKLKSRQVGTSQRIISSEETVSYPSATFCVWEPPKFYLANVGNTTNRELNYELPKVGNRFWGLEYTHMQENRYLVCPTNKATRTLTLK